VAERVRLVIWDLDGTYWKGTLTEGGYTYDDSIQQIVIELARRGIVSSICSKNDLAPVKAILQEKGVWDYFVLPSINWEPKGARLSAMIETFGLRPPTVLFIDDNHLNLEEAKHHVPDLQVADESIIPTILSSDLFKGKDDRELTRLKQYKLLERRARDAAAVGGDNIAFLRSCRVKAEVEFDVEKHLDRAIELINRTNQLNFTKRRLSEDPDLAREQLTAELRRTSVQAGLIRVTERYGDHGFVGFYMMDRRVDGQRRLLQFCFSCRVMNMHVEQWAYRMLGRPLLAIQGDVISDPLEDGYEIDWINSASREANDAGADTAAELPGLFARGGCNLAAVTHYFSLSCKNLVAEWNFIRGGVPIRLDHSLLLRYAIDGLPREFMPVAEQLGYRAEDFATQVFGGAATAGVRRLVACWADAEAPLYRHRNTGFAIPFWLVGAHARNMVATEHPQEAELRPEAKSALERLRAEFDHLGVQTREGLEANLASIAASVAAPDVVYVILPNDQLPDGARHNPRYTQLRAWLISALAAHPNLRAVDVRNVLHGPHELHDVNHFERMVYFRLYEHLSALFADRPPEAV
jgi:FkbH-like protein